MLTLLKRMFILIVDVVILYATAEFMNHVLIVLGCTTHVAMALSLACAFMILFYMNQRHLLRR